LRWAALYDRAVPSPVGDEELRQLQIAVVPNVRHLGGLPAGDGRTALHNVIRSGNLADLKPAGIDALRSLGVRCVVDLRTAEERDKAPEPDLAHYGLAQLWSPVVDRDPCPFGVHLEYGYAGYLWMYQNFLEYGRAAVAQLVHTLADTDGGMLFHCSLGQDRSGVVSAVLLGAVGVPDEGILEDHALSVTVETLARRGITGAEATHRATAPLHGMQALLDMIRERWGSAEGYLVDAGASRAAVDALKARVAG
jgi:protein-tyrosine phosphatase